MPRIPKVPDDADTTDILQDYEAVNKLMHKQLTALLEQGTHELSPPDVQMLIQVYYDLQNIRIHLGNQLYANTAKLTKAEGWDEAEIKQRGMTKAQVMRRTQTTVPVNSFLQFLYWSHVGLENRITQAMGVKAAESLPGQWLLAQHGVGPVLAAGLLAHLLPGGIPETVGSWWMFAGAAGDDPRMQWKKGQKRPWNTPLKTLRRKLSMSFVRVHTRPDDYYGKIYAMRKAQEVARNAEKRFAAQAAKALKEKNYKKDTDAYKAYSQGYLPPAHLEARAQRYCAKLFLAHLHEICYFHAYGKMPPIPYPLTFLEHEGHRHYIAPPFSELIPGLPEAQAQARKQFLRR